MRLFWLGVLTAHGFAAAAWWWLLPGGFSVGELRFWVNEALPLLLLALVVAVRFGTWRDPRVRDSILVLFPAFWLAVGLSVRVIFPISGQLFYLAPVGLGLVMAAAAWRTTKQPARWAWGVMPVVAGVGVLVTWAERGADPDTHPANVAMAIPAEWTRPEALKSIVLSPQVRLDPGDPVFTLTRGRMTLGVQPLLTFISRSPDRCWTLFASRQQRDGPRRALVHLEQSSGRVRLAHRDDTTSWTEAGMNDAALEIESMTRLERPIYSHLNTFTELTISGHRKLSVRFSPCPATRIDFKPFSIQGDAPSRAAYLTAGGTFRVVQARKAEKGPFTTLAEGPMRRSDALKMTLYDQERAVFEITLADWASQAGVQPSPTAGYGLPVNAIEFSIDGDSDRAPAGMWITLAATSVGRGWDSVGHAAGTYRNRVRVRVIDAEPLDTNGH